MSHRSSVLFADEPPQQSQPHTHTHTHRKKKRKHKSSPEKNKLFQIAQEETANSNSLFRENGRTSYATECNDDYELNSQIRYAVRCDEIAAPQHGHSQASVDGYTFGELRQTSVNGGSFEDSAVSALTEGSSVEIENSGGNGVAKSETLESLDLKRIVAPPDSNLKSPAAYFLEEVYNGNSLRSTTTLGNEKGRERVYDTIFRLPWRCELLIDVGFFVCFNSFLSLLTVMPTRIVMTIWRLLKTRKFKRPSTIELSDFGCFLIMACGVTLMQQIDISLIYHMIRGQATIKLYVIYNVLEIFDKLCQSFNGDVLQMLFHSAEGLARCPSQTESLRFWIWRFISDQVLAVVASIFHFISSGNHFIGLYCCSLQCVASFAGVK